jgi:hypothetical protein
MSNQISNHTPEKVLWVEGEVDSGFIHSLLKYYGLRLGIEVYPKGGINSLRGSLTKDRFLKTLSDTTTIKRFGIIADADSLAQGGAGFHNRWSQLIQDLTPTMTDLGVTIPTAASYETGEVFSKANDSLRIGLWLMPNHQEDGYLEDFILASTNWDLPLSSTNPNDQRKLKQYADDCWQALDQRTLKSFADYHHSKPSAYTWLAWQTKPTQFLSGTIEAGLLDMQHPYVLAFKDWIEKCFK